MGVTWSMLAPLFKQMGLPVLAWALQKIPDIAEAELTKLPFGSIYGPIAGGLVRKVLGSVLEALGLPANATPDDVKSAIETQPTSEVVNNLQQVESKAAILAPIVDAFKAESANDVEMAKVNQQSFAILQAAEVASNDPKATIYRKYLMWATSAMFVYVVAYMLFAVTWGSPYIERVVTAKELLMAIFTSLVAVLFGHFYTRGKERTDALKSIASTGQQPVQQQPTSTVVVNQEKAKPTPPKKRG